MSCLNIALNRIHEWNRPLQNPLKRIGLTRIGGVVCLALEAISFGLESSFWAIQGVIALSKGKALPKELFQLGLRVYRLFIGMLSTLIFGVFVSPEVNFNIHLALRLASDFHAESQRREIHQRLQKLSN